MTSIDSRLPFQAIHPACQTLLQANGPARVLQFAGALGSILLAAFASSAAHAQALTVSLDVSPEPIAEDQGLKEIRLRLSRRLKKGEELRVPVFFSGTAKWLEDFELAPPDEAPPLVRYRGLKGGGIPSLTFTGGKKSPTQAAIVLRAIDDSIDERPWESVRVGIGKDFRAKGITPAPTVGGNARFRITDDDTPVITVTGGEAVNEGDVATFTLTVEPVSARDFAVEFGIRQQGETVASDERGMRTVTISAGQASAQVAVDTLKDGIDTAPPAGKVLLFLREGKGYERASTSPAEVLVKDGDHTVVSIAALDNSATRGDPAETAGFQLTLARALQGSESIRLPLQFDGATPGEHFALKLANQDSAKGVSWDSDSNAVTFTAGQEMDLNAVLELTATADPGEEARTLRVTLPERIDSAALDGGVAGTGVAEISIVDQAVITVTGEKPEEKPEAAEQQAASDPRVHVDPGEPLSRQIHWLGRDSAHLPGDVFQAPRPDEWLAVFHELSRATGRITVALPDALADGSVGPQEVIVVLAAVIDQMRAAERLLFAGINLTPDEASRMIGHGAEAAGALRGSGPDAESAAALRQMTRDTVNASRELLLAIVDAWPGADTANAVAIVLAAVNHFVTQAGMESDTGVQRDLEALDRAARDAMR